MFPPQYDLNFEKNALKKIKTSPIWLGRKSFKHFVSIIGVKSTILCIIFYTFYIVVNMEGRGIYNLAKAGEIYILARGEHSAQLKA